MPPTPLSHPEYIERQKWCGKTEWLLSGRESHTVQRGEEGHGDADIIRFCLLGLIAGHPTPPPFPRSNVFKCGTLTGSAWNWYVDAWIAQRLRFWVLNLSSCYNQLDQLLHVSHAGHIRAENPSPIILQCLPVQTLIWGHFLNLITYCIYS